MKWPDNAPITRREIVPPPAAGTNWTRTSDAGGLWIVRGVTFILTTAAAVANRTVGLSLTEGTDVRLVVSAGAVQAASLVRRYTAFPGSASSADSPVALTLPWPSQGLVMPVGTTLSSVTDSIQAADQYSAIVLDITEFPATWPDWTIPLPTLYHYHMDKRDKDREDA